MYLTYLLLDHDGDGPGEAAAAMKLTSTHACAALAAVHGSDGGHAWATSGGAARPEGPIMLGNSPSPRSPCMAMINAVATTGTTAIAMAVGCHCWLFESACL